jgi:hypothetical protein
MSSRVWVVYIVWLLVVCYWRRTVDADASNTPQKAAWIVCDGVVVEGMWMWKWMGP